MQDDEDTATPVLEEREGTKSPIQEIEEEPFVKVEIKEGLEQLNEALKGEDLKEIRSCYSNLTKTFPTAVREMEMQTKLKFLYFYLSVFLFICICFYLSSNMRFPLLTLFNVCRI